MHHFSPPPLAFVLESEPLVALDLEQTLEELGFRVALFSTMEEVVGRCGKEAPALAILDVGDGSSAASIVSAFGREAAPAPLVLSSTSSPPGFPCDHVRLTRPFSHGELLRAIAKAMERAEVGDTVK